MKILTSDNFKRAIKDNLFNMGLQEIMHIDDSYINRTYEHWLATKMGEDYRSYVAMLLNLPDHIQFVDTDLLLFKISRKLGHDLVVQLAEGFYYDDNHTVIGEKLISTPLDDRRSITDLDVAYFLDIVDSIYDRTSCESISTLDMMRKAFRDDTYLAKIFV